MRNNTNAEISNNNVFANTVSVKILLNSSLLSLAIEIYFVADRLKPKSTNIIRYVDIDVANPI